MILILESKVLFKSTISNLDQTEIDFQVVHSTRHVFFLFQGFLIYFAVFQKLSTISQFDKLTQYILIQ